MKRLIYAFTLVLGMMGCKEVFEAPPQALLLGTFYNSVTNQPMSPVVTLLGVGQESLVVDELTSNNVLFPLTITDTTRFIIWLDSTADSITFVHQSIQKLASVEKGFYYEYKLRSVAFTQNRIDSVRIVDSLVTTKWNENIKLYIGAVPDSIN
jgi:hypothetical protein